MRILTLAIALSLGLAGCAHKHGHDQAAVAEPAPPPASAQSETLDRIEVSGSRIGAMHAPAKMVAEFVAPAPLPVDRENYAQVDENPIHLVEKQPLSTFSIDVDTGSYSNVRRMLNAGRLPSADAVRSEEFLNYFDYGYAVPERGGQPFSVTTEIAPSPWHRNRHLLLVGLKGYEVPKAQVPAANLVFLIDTSGSMHSADKLALLKQSFRLLVQQLRPQDRVAIVAYAGSAGLVLESTPGSDKASILASLDRLQAGGSTHGSAGIQLAYDVAQQHFIAGGANRVILASDGDFNVGTVNHEALKDLVAEKRKTGIALTTLGFGGGNYNDALAEQLANVGNGQHAYIDTLNEGRKVLVESLSSTLLTIAADVKVQIEFNPAVVAEYRLIGYENRLLRREDFSNDQVDAGEIGAGHSVTALYELALTGSGGEAIEPLRYATQAAADGNPKAAELAHLRLRYKSPGEDVSRLIETPILRRDIAGEASERLRFASAVAGFAEALRGGRHLGDWTLDDVLATARSARGEDAFGYRGEFLQLVEMARALSSQRPQDGHLAAPE